MPVNGLLVQETSRDHPMHGSDPAVQLIGDIMPYVLSRYGIDLSDAPLAATQDAQLEYDFAI